MSKKLLSLLSILLLVIPAGAYGDERVKVVSKHTEDYWTCYDYTIDYTRNHPEWGRVTLFNTCQDKVTHMVNYQLINGELEIHDGLYQLDYTITDWEDKVYFNYHFWTTNETPARNYLTGSLTDNTEEFMNHPELFLDTTEELHIIYFGRK
jgi:hypothetical protein